MNQKITITILVRVDTVERLENIRAVVNFLFQNGFQNIRLIEAAALCNGFVEELLAKRINYSFKIKTNFFSPISLLNMIRYSNRLELLIEKDLELFIDSFKTKVQHKLKTLECRTEMHGDCITIHRIVRYFPLSGQGKNEILKLLRDGRIEIRKIGPVKIKIKWVVKLEGLLFMSAWIGFLTGLGFGFVNSSIPIFIMAGISFFLIAYFIGYIIIRSQIDEIVFTAIDNSPITNT